MAGGEEDREHHGKYRRPCGDPPGHPFRRGCESTAERRSDQRLSCDRQGIEKERNQVPQLEDDLVCTDYSRTEPRRHCSRGNETRLECEAAQNQVTAHQHLRPHDRKMWSSRNRFTKERPGEQHTRNTLAHQIRNS